MSIPTVVIVRNHGVIQEIQSDRQVRVIVLDYELEGLRDQYHTQTPMYSEQSVIMADQNKPLVDATKTWVVE